MKSKKLFSLFLSGIFIFGMCGTALASEPQYAENVVFKFEGNVNGDVIPINAPVYAYRNCKEEEGATWSLIYREKNLIVEACKLTPWGAAELTRGITSNGPYTMELLSVNGVPWQIFDAPDKVPVEVTASAAKYWMILGLSQEEAEQMEAEAEKTLDKISDDIKHMQTDSRVPWSKVRQTLPQPGKKMVSVYRDNTAAALYTHNTVEAKHLVARPQIIDGSLMVPLTGIVDYLGADIGWNDAAKMVIIKTADKEIKLKPGETAIEVNGQEKVLDTPATIIDGRTMIPLRFVSEELGYTVKWWGSENPEVPRADIYN